MPVSLKEPLKNILAGVARCCFPLSSREATIHPDLSGSPPAFGRAEQGRAAWGPVSLDHLELPTLPGHCKACNLRLKSPFRKQTAFLIMQTNPALF